MTYDDYQEFRKQKRISVVYVTIFAALAFFTLGTVGHLNHSISANLTYASGELPTFQASAKESPFHVRYADNSAASHRPNF